MAPILLVQITCRKGARLIYFDICQLTLRLRASLNFVVAYLGSIVKGGRIDYAEGNKI
jgi:hypothetical protein